MYNNVNFLPEVSPAGYIIGPSKSSKVKIILLLYVIWLGGIFCSASGLHPVVRRTEAFFIDKIPSNQLFDF